MPPRPRALERFLLSGLRHLVVLEADDQCVGVLVDRQIAGTWAQDPVGLQLRRVATYSKPTDYVRHNRCVSSDSCGTPTRWTVAEANEVLDDVDAVWFDSDPKSKTGRSIRVIGYSPSRQQILTIILVRDPAVDWLWGANGWPSNSTDRGRYR